MYAKTFLGLLALMNFSLSVTLAARCEKGNGHNQGGNCHGKTGNLACSNNLNHVVSYYVNIDPVQTPKRPLCCICCLESKSYFSLDYLLTRSVARF